MNEVCAVMRNYAAWSDNFPEGRRSYLWSGGLKSWTTKFTVT